ncbi:GNAT family N-acetyltransferase, partial [Micromonospora sp. NPDC051296]|uniref:GNAT family N-acetyltransferase n=1 Tax=Micromonospora sp. NPDC051296 TaxID=3155046 RepID=UPI003422B357
MQLPRPCTSVGRAAGRIRAPCAPQTESFALIEVLPAARRQGLAARLIRALADWAAEAGAT